MPQERTQYVAVTSGMANAIRRGRMSDRMCAECGMGFPIYPGRYPCNCPRCGGPVERIRVQEDAPPGTALDSPTPQTRQNEYLLGLPDGSGHYRAYMNGLNQWDVWFLVHNLPPTRIAKGIQTLKDAKSAAENHMRLIVGEAREDILPGGKGDDRSPEDFDPVELALGVRHEQEHTDNPAIALEIAMDHLTEDPHYYTKLAIGVVPSEDEAGGAVGGVSFDIAPSERSDDDLPSKADLLSFAAQQPKPVAARASSGVFLWNFADEGGARAFLNALKTTFPNAEGDIFVRQGSQAPFEVSAIFEAQTICVSAVPRLQRLIDAGESSSLPYREDPLCSPVRSVPYTVMEDGISGGVRGMMWFLEGPSQTNPPRYYRLEGIDDPVLIFEFDETVKQLRIFATRAPSEYIGWDPRADLVAEAVAREDRNGVTALVEVTSALPANAKGLLDPIAVKKANALVPAHAPWVLARSYYDPGFYRADLVPSHEGPRDDAHTMVFTVGPDDRDDETGEPLGWSAELAPTHNSALRGKVPVFTGLGDTVNDALKAMSRNPYKHEAIDVHTGPAGQTTIAEKPDGAGGPVSEPKEPGAGNTRIHGGTRFEIGYNKKRKPRKNVELSIQNRMNARRGLAARVRAAKKWHRSHKGGQLHRDLARYNTGNAKGESRGDIFWEVILPHALADPVTEDMGETDRTIDDVLDGIIRRLITIESTDILQDVEFADDGAIYLFFDPILTAKEMDEILQAVRQEAEGLSLVGSPDKSLPGEMVKSDWWVVYVPPSGAGAGTTQPDPKVYAAETPPPGATAPQTGVVMATSSIDQIAMSIDIDKLIASIGKGAEPRGGPVPESEPAGGRVLPMWVAPGGREFNMRGVDEVVALFAAASAGRGRLFLIRESSYDAAVQAVGRGRLRNPAPGLWTNLDDARSYFMARRGGGLR